MRRCYLCGVAVIFGFTSSACGQTYGQPFWKNEQLKPEITRLESAVREKGEDRENENADHDHDEASHQREHDEDHANALPGTWRFHDPRYPGWWKPSDEYRPGSWMAPPKQGFFKDLLFGDFVETHRSTRGTPWVHPFTIEPPHLHRDMFFFYKLAKRAEGTPADEHELEIHLDWALTRRFGILVAAPYLGIDAPNEQATGFGDIEVAPRVVLIESDTFFLSTNIFMTFPTGDEDRDLGRGEMTLAPLLTSWHDLGSGCLPWTNWNTMYLNAGPEWGLESGDRTLLYTVVFSHTFLAPRVLFPHQHGNGNGHNGNGHNGNGHKGHENGGTISFFGPGYPVGLTSLIVEFNGQTDLRGDGQTLLQLLTGFSYVLTDTAELRFGTNFPLNRSDQQMDIQYILGFTYVF